MFYYNLRFFNYVFGIFGLKKPFIMNTERVSKITALNRVWTLTILIVILTWYFFFVRELPRPGIKNNLDLICESNELIVCSLAVVAYLLQPQSSYITLYSTIHGLIRRFKVKAHDLKKFCLKLYLLSLIPLVTFAAIGIWIICSRNPPHLILIRIPLFLENWHLLLHICVIIALLKTMNAKLATKLHFNKKTFFCVEKETEKKLLIAFTTESSDGEYFETKYFCQVYDDLCNSMKLLEKQHGLQILLESWMIFASAVVQFTLIASQKVEFPLLTVLRLVAPLLWYTIVGYLDDQIRQEVELTDILIMKYLIEFRCDQTSRYLLTTFKQLVSTNRLRFRACGLLQINYAMVLGTVVSIVTYSIIMIQLFTEK